MSTSRTQLKCRQLWKLCRRHGWSSPISRDALVNLALESAIQGQGRDIVHDLIEEPYIEFHVGRGYSLKNNPDAQAQAAYRLKDVCGYSEIQIEATLSRFEQAGGFSAYDAEALRDALDSWD